MGNRIDYWSSTRWFSGSGTPMLWSCVLANTCGCILFFFLLLQYSSNVSLNFGISLQRNIQIYFQANLCLESKWIFTAWLFFWTFSGGFFRDDGLLKNVVQISLFLALPLHITFCFWGNHCCFLASGMLIFVIYF